MRYLTGSELHGFHDSFLRALKKQSLSQSDEEWEFPSGFEICDTFSFRTEHGTLFIGHLDRIKELGRWWIPITLEDNSHAPYIQLLIDFEMSIPTQLNLYLSVHYTMELFLSSTKESSQLVMVASARANFSNAIARIQANGS